MIIYIYFFSIYLLSIYHQQRRVEIIHFNNDNDEITNRDKYIYIAKGDDD